MVPKPQNTKTLIQEVAIAPVVIRAVRMLRTIEFDHKTRFTMAEIGKILTDRHLPNELMTAEAPVS